MNVYLRWLLNKGEQVSYPVHNVLCVGVCPLCEYIHQAEQVKRLVAQCSVLSCSPVSEHLQTVQEGNLPLCHFAEYTHSVKRKHIALMQWIESISH